jgi:hypothetical protein
MCVAVATGAGASAQSPYAAKPIETVNSSAVRGFSVALVLGDMQGALTPDNMPNGARKALVDLRDFLPYKSYRLLDTQWLLCCGDSKAGISGRLRGLDDQTYGFIVDVLGVHGSKLSLRFSLRDDVFKKPGKPGDILEDVARPPAPPKGPILDSTFSMEVGETVVIGTSALKGDKALIALLTAAPRNSSTSTQGEKR